jgi:hypothetical protein
VEKTQSTELKMIGHVEVTCLDEQGELVWQERYKNDITNVGLTLLLNVMFNSGSQATSWYIGLISNSNFTAVSTSDTMASHSGWQELATYSESTRPQWDDLSGENALIGNATPVEFTITTASVIKGIFLVNNNTKGGTTGTLWNTGVFPVVRSVAIGQKLQVNYKLSAVGSS